MGRFARRGNFAILKGPLRLFAHVKLLGSRTQKWIVNGYRTAHKVTFLEIRTSLPLEDRRTPEYKKSSSERVFTVALIKVNRPSRARILYHRPAEAPGRTPAASTSRRTTRPPRSSTHRRTTPTRKGHSACPRRRTTVSAAGSATSALP